MIHLQIAKGVKMPLTVNDVVLRLKHDQDTYDVNDMQDILDASSMIVKNHVKAKFDAENEQQRLAILLLCGWLDKNRNAEGKVTVNGFAMPPMVYDILLDFYTPLVM